MLKFISTDADAFGPKRKKSQRACVQCRKRKKRCNHVPILTESSRPARHHPASHSAPRPKPFDASSGNEQPRAHDDLSESEFQEHDSGTSPGSSNGRNTTFDVNTNGKLLPTYIPSDGGQQDETLLEHAQEPENSSSRFIGHLNPEALFRVATSPDMTQGSSSANNTTGIWLTDKLSKEAIQIEPPSSFEHSSTSMFYGSPSIVQKVLVPILEQECLSLLPPPLSLGALCSFYFEKMHPIFPVIDRRGFDSLPSSSPDRILLQQGLCIAASMGRYSSEHLRLSDSEPPLSHRTFGKRLLSVMRTSIEIGLVTDQLILIQALSLMSFFVDSPEGRDMSSQICGRVVQHVHALGLHIQGRARSKTDGYAVPLLCCVWALDRMNAAFHGRPVLMHERDIGRNLETCFDEQEPCFRLFLRVIRLLDEVIDTYRPQFKPYESNLEHEFLSFEDLLAKCDGLHISTPLLATIEVLYHAVAILSYRSRPFEAPSRSSPSYVRQSLSASRVSSMVGHEFRDQLIFFPFVPYAVSLSLSVAYRELRHNRVPMHRTRARTHLQTNCKVLDELGEIFWSAAIMSEMGKSTLKELDRVYSTVSDLQPRRNEQEVDYRAPNDANDNGSNHLPLDSGQGLLQTSRPNTNLLNENLDMPYMQDFDPSVFNKMPDFDIFEMFDPNFDLNGIDACLEGNLDLSFPTNWQLNFDDR